MAEEIPIEDSQNVQVDGAELLGQGLKSSTPSEPLTLDSLFRLITTHHHQGSDGSETLRQGRITMGLVTRSAGGVETVTHGMNSIPKYVLIFAVGSVAVNGIFSIGWGKGIASTGDYQVIFSDNSSSSFSTDRIVEVRSASGTSLTATLTRLDPTEFDLSWTLSGSITLRYIWVAFS